jgi:hypothetical protein
MPTPKPAKSHQMQHPTFPAPHPQLNSNPTLPSEVRRRPITPPSPLASHLVNFPAKAAMHHAPSEGDRPAAPVHQPWKLAGWPVPSVLRDASRLGIVNCERPRRQNKSTFWRAPAHCESGLALPAHALAVLCCPSSVLCSPKLPNCHIACGPSARIVLFPCFFWRKVQITRSAQRRRHPGRYRICRGPLVVNGARNLV